MDRDITELPDYPTLKKLATALWQQDNSYYGAAVMVGAGFSRIAASSGDASNKLPLWYGLSKLLAAEIDFGNQTDLLNQTDPLRLAEEYRAYFGQQALLDLLKRTIHDEAWTPGGLHKDLLKLPWSEVLTTNWDTLLERASNEVHQPAYSIVNRQEDLSSARAPRIVKLHGTIGITNELVFTQEDFRKYPQRYAAFVNFARQVFIENELCLLGFSGDDPNFLQWAGWVRDHLATHARRIYIVGALSLTAAKRKYLESINVAPIDLSSLVAIYDDPDSRHAEATKIFIRTLLDHKPKQTWEWMPTQLHRATLTSEETNKTHKDHAYAAKLLEGQIAALESDRLSYPGWLVCPPSLLFRMQSQIIDPFPTIKNLSAMMPNSRARLLHEIAWRCDVTYEVMPSWLIKELLTVCDPDKPCIPLTKRHQMEVALLLLKNSRWLDESEAKSISQITAVILEKNSKYWPDSINELAYCRAIVARDGFDFLAMESIVEKLDTSDPIWKLKKASLLAELGRFNEGKDLISKAYRELLDQHRKDRNSINIFSRLAWAHLLMRSIHFFALEKDLRVFPLDYRNYKCSPWDYIEYIQNQVVKTLERQRESQGIEPLFEPGSYKDKSTKVTFSGELHPLLLLEGVSRTVGMPLRWSNTDFLAESAAKLTELDDLNDEDRLTLAIRSASNETSGVLNKVFSRLRVVSFANENVNSLMNRCEVAIKYWSDRLENGTVDSKDYIIQRLQVFIEVLARISVRATPEQAKRLFRLALALGKKTEFHNIWLFDVLDHLIKYALKSIPETHQHELLLEALLFPLQTEIRIKEHPKQWPNPVIRLPGSRVINASLDRRIDEIIDSIAPCSYKSAPALLRLLPLLDAGFLSETEREKIGRKIWGDSPDYQTLPQTGLLPHALLTLPAPDNSTAREAVRRYLFNVGDDRFIEQTFLVGLANAARIEKGGELPSSEQAMLHFEKFVSWRMKNSIHDPFGYSEQKEKQIGRWIGDALAHAVIPALPFEVFNQQNFDKLLAFYKEVGAPSTIIAFYRFASADDGFAKRVEKLIRQGLQGRDANKVASSAFALLKWREAMSSLATDRLTSRLVYLLGLNLSGGLSALLWTARQMYVKRYLSDDDVELLVESVPEIFDGADYNNITPSSREAVSISLVRAECVRLAKAILDENRDKNSELLRVLEEAQRDPLPEVRFAETTDD